MDGMTEALLRSLKRNGIDYSDIFIRGPDTESVGRLVLDRFSGTLYSSSPDVFAEIEDLVHCGCTMQEAIEAVAFPDVAPLREAAE
jgi:conjugal transfer ATP-binding protein TraC